ncbi:MAG: helix-turn-helix transcriptional regulator [Saprospiraceae bacterium]|nr:helix-turn-helix transcriptional regulator [Saprospiraceae bacterium]
MKRNKNITTFEEHLARRYGQIGSEQRKEFEAKAKSFVIGELLKEERLEANLTQEELADKIGAKKSYISRVENGKSDIQLSTLFRLFEYGLGKRINIIIE